MIFLVRDRGHQLQLGDQLLPPLVLAPGPEVLVSDQNHAWGVLNIRSEANIHFSEYYFPF